MLPKVPQIKIFLLQRKINYINLNLVKFQLQSTSQQKANKNAILRPISDEICSFQNAPNFKPLFLGFDTSLNYGTKNLEYETIPIITSKKGHQKWNFKKTLTYKLFLASIFKDKRNTQFFLNFEHLVFFKVFLNIIAPIYLHAKYHISVFTLQDAPS